jgi:peptidyl-prolyl cis-trans isomerase SurA
MAVAVSGLSACRTAPNVAAYVGDEQVTVSELDAAVADRLEDDVVAAYAEDQGDDYTRRVLSALVQREVYDAAAQRAGVEVTDAAVRDRIDEVLAAQWPDNETAYAELATQGYTRADVFEEVRELVLRQEIAEAEGQGDALSEEALRARYEDTKDSLTSVSMGYITVPDQATADAVLAQLTASPADYATVAARYPGPATTPELEVRMPEDVPAVLAQGVAAAAPNTGFTIPVAEAGGVVVTFVQGTPTFEQVREDLEQQARGELDQAGAKLVSDVRDDLGVRFNPRFGVPKDDKLVAGSGVVDILGDEDTATQ